MTRTSAIFGVVSVLTAAIVGGVFIRKKIIDDALYWKAFAEFEENKRRKIKALMEEIVEFNTHLKQNKYKKDDLDNQIKKQNKNLEIFDELIKKHKESIETLGKFKITKVQKTDKNLKKKENLKNKYKEIEQVVNDLKNQTYNEDSNEKNNLTNRISKLNETLSKITNIIYAQKQTFDKYASDRIGFQNKLNAHAVEIKKSEELKTKLNGELEKNNKFLNQITQLIQELKEKIMKKEQDLLNVKSQKFIA